MTQASAHVIESTTGALPTTLHTKFELWESFVQVLNRDVLFILCVVYPLGIAVLNTVAKNQEWGDLCKKSAAFGKAFKAFNLGYNVLMSLFSLAITLLTADAMRRMPIMQNDCERYNNDRIFDTAMWYFYLSKYVEFIDTIFLIVRGKDVSWLHYLHHIGAPINMGIIYWSRIEAGWIFSLLNGIIHTLMYGYYGVTSLGYRVPGLFKMTLTTLQIAQFLTGFTILYFYASVPCWAASAERMMAWWYTYLYVGIVLVLFVSFYVKTYIMKQVANKKK